MLNVYELQKNINIPFYSFKTHDELLAQFENLGILSHGSEAVVFKVRNIEDNKLYALRIAHNFVRLLTPRKNFLRRIFEIQNHIPHLIKTFAAFLVEYKSYPVEGGKKKRLHSYGNIPKGHFIRTDYAKDPDATTYYREVVVMELGSGALNTFEFQNLQMDRYVVNIQRVFNRYCLFEHGIILDDERDYNYVWQPVEEAFYNGVCLKEFSYWHYQIGEYHLYLPRQDYVIKRVDLGRWESPKEEIEEKDKGLHWMKYLEEKEKPFNVFLDQYSKPKVPASQILDINIL